MYKHKFSLFSLASVGPLLNLVRSDELTLVMFGQNPGYCFLDENTTDLTRVDVILETCLSRFSVVLVRGMNITCELVFSGNLTCGQMSVNLSLMEVMTSRT